MSLIFHIPHSSLHIPTKYLSDFRLTPEALEAEKVKMTDTFTDELFLECLNANDADLVFPVSRLLVDVERFSEDQFETMSEIGMGMLYTSCHDLSPLRKSNIFAHELKTTYYDAHHAAFTELVASHLESYGSALIIDCHSFPTRPWPYERNQTGNRPEICIGTDPFHTSSEVEIALKNAFQKQELTVDLDTPFSGSIVPIKFYEKDHRVQSVMIEVRRDLYMDEETGAKNNRFADTKNKIKLAMNSFRQQLTK
jgi:N-formylglutamate deformylase